MLCFSLRRQQTIILFLILVLLLSDIFSIEAKTNNKHSKKNKNKHKKSRSQQVSHGNKHQEKASRSKNKNHNNQDLAHQTNNGQNNIELNKSLYPDYCWFDGLENRVLVEYPQLHELVKNHDEKLYKEKDLIKAAELHKEIFMRIYENELEKLTHDHDKTTIKQAQNGIDSPEKRAAYKLFDLWANTPGDYERKQDDYSNYLEPYLIQTQIEFWSYCLDDRIGCEEVLNQLSVLAREQELGPVEFLQVSLNIIMLMNSYKADLLLEKLIERNVIKLNEFNDSINKEANHDDEEKIYYRVLEDVVSLIETDEDFNEASFHYTFTKTNLIDKYIDPKIESFFANKIRQFSQQNNSS